MLGCIFWLYFSQHTKINHLQSEVNILWNYRLNQQFLKERIKNLENENKLLQLDNEYYKNHYIADKLYIDKLESDYLMAISYIGVAEYILLKQGIEYLYLGDR